MRTDFLARAALAAMLLAFSTACGQQRTVGGVFEKAGPACNSMALPKRFVVKYFDGRTELVKAESKEAFLNGFLTENLEKVEYAEHDFEVKLNDVRQTDFRSFADNWGASKADLGAMWTQNMRGSGVIVAVVDTGMDFTHPQLASRLAKNSGEIAGNGVDDDGNGYVDDDGGWDFVRNRRLQGDYTGHGTHVSGIIAAVHSDQAPQGHTYVQGVAPEAKILPLAFLGEGGSGSMLDGVTAIKYAVSRGAKVINASWGGSQCSRALRDTIEKLHSQGVIMVTASGNDSQNIDRIFTYPASLDFPAQIVVGAVGPFGSMAEYSNYGSRFVHIFAPGTDVVSTFPQNRMASLSGTSMATPFVAGAIAILLGAEPTANVEQIRQALYNSSTKDFSYLNASQGQLRVTESLTELRNLLH